MISLSQIPIAAKLTISWPQSNGFTMVMPSPASLVAQGLSPIALSIAVTIWGGAGAGVPTHTHTASEITGLSYEHTQGVPSTSWVVNHNMNKYPSVTVVDSSGDEVEGQIDYTGRNAVTLTFAAAFSGKAYLN